MDMGRKPGDAPVLRSDAVTQLVLNDQHERQVERMKNSSSRGTVEEAATGRHHYKKLQHEVRERGQQVTETILNTMSTKREIWMPLDAHPSQAITTNPKR